MNLYNMYYDLIKSYNSNCSSKCAINELVSIFPYISIHKHIVNVILINIYIYINELILNLLISMILIS